MSAVISSCGQYRYRLDRACKEPSIEGKVFAYFGINPSTANAYIDDATVRKWRGFTERNGGCRFIVGNLFSYRATNVSDLFGIKAQGDEHWKYIHEIIAEADVLVPCWGNRSKIPYYLREEANAMIEHFINSKKPILHFGLTKSGDPKHPLMLGYDTPLTEWVRK